MGHPKYLAGLGELKVDQTHARRVNLTCLITCFTSSNTFFRSSEHLNPMYVQPTDLVDKGPTEPIQNGTGAGGAEATGE